MRHLSENSKIELFFSAFSEAQHPEQMTIMDLPKCPASIPLVLPYFFFLNLFVS